MMATDPPNTLKNRIAARDRKRLEPTRADRQAEKNLLHQEVAEEIEARKTDQRKRTDGGSPKQKRADWIKSLAQQNNPRKVRAYLLKVAPELETPRLMPVLEIIIRQMLLHRDLMQAHKEQREVHLKMGTALMQVVEALPPPPMEWNEETIKLLKNLDSLYARYLTASPFLYVEKIENVVAKLTALLKDNGLTVKAARMMEYDLEDELLRYKGAIAAAESAVDGEVKSNQQIRAELTHQTGDAVDDDENETEFEDPAGGEEGDDDEATE